MLIDVQDSWIIYLSQYLSSSSFGASNVGFLFPVESNKIDAEVSWKLTDLGSLFVNPVVIFLFTFKRKSDSILDRVNWFVVVVDIASQYKMFFVRNLGFFGFVSNILGGAL